MHGLKTRKCHVFTAVLSAFSSPRGAPSPRAEIWSAQWGDNFSRPRKPRGTRLATLFWPVRAPWGPYAPVAKDSIYHESELVGLFNIQEVHGMCVNTICFQEKYTYYLEMCDGDFSRYNFPPVSAYR